MQWDAAFRSRLYFARPEKAETEDANARILSRKAANYGPRNATIQLRWQEGLFVPPAGGLLGSIKKRSTERIFVERLGQVQGQGLYVNANKTTPRYAPKVFAGMNGIAEASERRTKDEFELAMLQLLKDGVIRNGEGGRRGKEHDEIVLVGNAPAYL